MGQLQRQQIGQLHHNTVDEWLHQDIVNGTVTLGHSRQDNYITTQQTKCYIRTHSYFRTQQIGQLHTRHQTGWLHYDTVNGTVGHSRQDNYIQIQWKEGITLEYSKWESYHSRLANLTKDTTTQQTGCYIRTQ